MQARKRNSIVQAACLVLSLSACGSTGSTAPALAPELLRAGPIAAALEAGEPGWYDAGVSVEGRPLRFAVHGEGHEVVLLLASIHGDEGAGTRLFEALLERLDRGPRWLAGRRVVTVPVANPDGLAAGRRGNARGIDINRNLPAANFLAARKHGTESLSEPESRALHALVQGFLPTRILSVHQPAELLDWNGPAEKLARALGPLAGLEVRQLGSRPGSLGSWAGDDLGVPTLTLELPRSAGGLSASELWGAYGVLIRDFIGWPGGLEPGSAAPGSGDQRGGSAR